MKLDFCGPNSHLRKVQYRFLNTHQISNSGGKKIFKSVQKQQNYVIIKNAKIVMFKWTYVVQRVI